MTWPETYEWTEKWGTEKCRPIRSRPCAKISPPAGLVPVEARFCTTQRRVKLARPPPSLSRACLGGAHDWPLSIPSGESLAPPRQARRERCFDLVAAGGCGNSICGSNSPPPSAPRALASILGLTPPARLVTMCTDSETPVGIRTRRRETATKTCRRRSRRAGNGVFRKRASKDR